MARRAPARSRFTISCHRMMARGMASGSPDTTIPMTRSFCCREPAGSWPGSTNRGLVSAGMPSFRTPLSRMAYPESRQYEAVSEPGSSEPVEAVGVESPQARVPTAITTRAMPTRPREPPLPRRVGRRDLERVNAAPVGRAPSNQSSGWMDGSSGSAGHARVALGRQLLESCRLPVQALADSLPVHALLNRACRPSLRRIRLPDHGDEAHRQRLHLP